MTATCSDPHSDPDVPAAGAAEDLMGGEELASEVGEADERERLARIVLASVTEPGSYRLWSLAREVGAVEAVEFLRTDAGRDWFGRESGLRRIGRDPYSRAADLRDEAATIGARFLIPDDREWPDAALHGLVLLGAARTMAAAGGRTMDEVERDVAPPLGLWVRGPANLAEVCERCVSIVGARASSGYGNHVATEMAHGLAERDWAVVSGGAYGIDTAAHRGALAGDGPTVAVLASGVDTAYPSGNATLFDLIANSGLLVSEWPPGAEPRRHRFLIRNRVIAALGAGTVVVEAAARSGARSTARRAGELGRMVMAVPGPITSAMSVGCHQLLRADAARLVCSATEILEEVGRIGVDLAGIPRAPITWRDELSPAAAAVLEAIPADSVRTADALADDTGLSPESIRTAVTALTSAGLLWADGTEYRLTTLATGSPFSDRQTRPDLR